MLRDHAVASGGAPAIHKNASRRIPPTLGNWSQTKPRNGPRWSSSPASRRT